MTTFLVMLRRSGPAWHASLPPGEQSDRLPHADYMDSLVETGFLVLGGPLADEHRVVLVCEAESEDVVRERLAQDPWSESHLQIDAVERWRVRLDGRRR